MRTESSQGGSLPQIEGLCNKERHIIWEGEMTYILPKLVGYMSLRLMNLILEENVECKIGKRRRWLELINR